eukprot:gnl/Chilomastix_cuspidata/5684.p1 GENE.gnl/Chilomastix_cuspidata/5684~~gnl/Chilomastix_cuspidata/5684.p1  ORF type:complete len:263 (+),score=23.36 gnl/Chilomastix_cuspidata/5684:30-818(+)
MAQTNRWRMNRPNSATPSPVCELPQKRAPDPSWEPVQPKHPVSEPDVQTDSLDEQSLLRVSAPREPLKRFWDPDNMICFHCMQEGHTMTECANAAHQVCFLCGGANHTARLCPHIVCFSCGQTGHLHVKCRAPDPQRAATACLPRVCSRCGDTHASIFCHTFLEQQCSMCGERGHPAYDCPHRSERGWRRPMKERAPVCPVCGFAGHTYQECRTVAKASVFAPPAPHTHAWKKLRECCFIDETPWSSSGTYTNHALSGEKDE